MKGYGVLTDSQTLWTTGVIIDVAYHSLEFFYFVYIEKLNSIFVAWGNLG